MASNLPALIHRSRLLCVSRSSYLCRSLRLNSSDSKSKTYRVIKRVFRLPHSIKRAAGFCNSLLLFNNGESAENASEINPEIQKLSSELDELKDKNSELLDKYRRSIAENENMRKRLTKQIEDAKVFGIQGFCKDLLDVSDVLSKAVETLPEDAHPDIRDGMKLTESQLLQVFTRHGLVKENPLNEKFDPNKHEAAFQIPAPQGVEANIVLDVQKVGFILQGRTIRPAVVGVSKK